MAKEQKIQSSIVKYLKSIGAYYVKVIAGTRAGIPDIIICYKGLFIAIEVKTPETKNNVSKLQEHNLEQIKKAGGIKLVAWELEQVKRLIETIDRNLK